MTTVVITPLCDDCYSALLARRLPSGEDTEQRRALAAFLDATGLWVDRPGQTGPEGYWDCAACTDVEIGPAHWITVWGGDDHVDPTAPTAPPVPPAWLSDGEKARRFDRAHKLLADLSFQAPEVRPANAATVERLGRIIVGGAD